jgi:hypothetical protein
MYGKIKDDEEREDLALRELPSFSRPSSASASGKPISPEIQSHATTT